MSFFKRLSSSKSFRIYPFCLVLLTFCGHKKKEHKIPYEQMPLELRDDAQTETRNLVSKFKSAYSADLSRDFVSIILNTETKNLKNPNDNEQSLTEQNKSLVLNTDASSTTFKNEFLTSIQGQNLNFIKNNLETFIKEQLHKTGDTLLYTEEAKSPLSLLLTKKSDAQSYAGLLSLIASEVTSREQLRAQRLALIFTPNSMTLGLVLNDQEQGQLLFGYPNTALGTKTKYYGPTAQLKGNIVVIDIEGYLILKALAPSLKDLEAPRAFILDHSSKKFRYDQRRLDIQYKKENNHNVFEITGSQSEKTPEENSAFIESTLSFVSGFSDLNEAGLEASYKAHKEGLSRQEELRRIQEEQARLGNNFELERKWPHSFQGWDSVVSYIKDTLSTNAYAPLESIRVEKLARNRECHESDESRVSSSRLGTLRDFGILGVDELWAYENLEKDDLGMCRARSAIGTLSNPTVIKQHTRILQPIYVFLPKNPTNLSQDEFEKKKNEIKETQRSAIKELSKKFCGRLMLTDIDSVTSHQGIHAIRGLWRDLFHNEENSVEKLHSSVINNNNYFEIRCLFIPSSTPVIPTPTPEDTESSEDKREKETGVFNPQSGQIITTPRRVSIGN